MDFFSFLSMLQYGRILLSSTSDSPSSTLPENAQKSKREPINHNQTFAKLKFIYALEAYYRPDWLMVTPVSANMIF